MPSRLLPANTASIDAIANNNPIASAEGNIIEGKRAPATAKGNAAMPVQKSNLFRGTIIVELLFFSKYLLLPL
jgi:hypothetical protein